MHWSIALIICILSAEINSIDDGLAFYNRLPIADKELMIFEVCTAKNHTFVTGIVNRKDYLPRARYMICSTNRRMSQRGFLKGISGGSRVTFLCLGSKNRARLVMYLSRILPKVTAHELEHSNIHMSIFTRS